MIKKNPNLFIIIMIYKFKPNKILFFCKNKLFKPLENNQNKLL